MSFEPISVNPRSRRCKDPLRYCVKDVRDKQRLTIMVAGSLLQQVKGGPKYWRLDIDRAGGKGRLTGLIQHDGNPATTAGSTPPRSLNRLFTWLASPDVLPLFPQLSGTRPLSGAEVTSMGIEFDLPN